MQVVKFWPPIPSVVMAAQKWNTVEILDMVAAANGWKRPQTTILTPGCTIPEGTVLKRSHSDCGESVILPGHSVKGDLEPAVTERSRLDGLRSWDVLNAKTFSDEQKWVSQEYVEALVTLGEWRCFIVGGHVSSVVHTVNRGTHWEGKRVTRFKSLRQIR